MLRFAPIALLLFVLASASIRQTPTAPGVGSSPKVSVRADYEGSRESRWMAFVAPLVDETGPGDPRRSPEDSLLPSPPQATSEVTKEEIGALSRSGVSEEILLAYVSAKGRPTSLGADDLVELKRMGLSNRVLTFLIGSPEVSAGVNPDEFSALLPPDTGAPEATPPMDLRPETTFIPFPWLPSGTPPSESPASATPDSWGPDPEEPFESGPSGSASWDVLPEAPTIIFVSGGACRCPKGMGRPSRRPIPAMGPSRFSGGRPVPGGGTGGPGRSTLLSPGPSLAPSPVPPSPAGSPSHTGGSTVREVKVR